MREFGGTADRTKPLLRWRPADGWQQLVLIPELQPLASSGLYAEGDTFWFSGIGVLRLPASALRFTPLR